jgi:hypothetical protein
MAISKTPSRAPSKSSSRAPVSKSPPRSTQPSKPTTNTAAAKSSFSKPAIAAKTKPARTAGLSPSQAQAKLTTPLKRAPNQTARAAASQRAAIQADAGRSRAVVVAPKPTLASRVGTALGKRSTSTTAEGASVAFKRQLPASGSFANTRSVKGSVKTNGTASVTAERTRERDLGKRTTGSLSETTIKRNARRDAAAARGQSFSLGKVEGERRVGVFDSGKIKGDTGVRAQVLTAAVSGSGEAVINRKQVKLTGSVSAEANLVKVEGQFKRTVGGREFQGSGSASVAVAAKANGALVFQPRNGEVRVNVGAEAFAGAKAGVSGSAEIFPGIKLTGEGDVRAGIGAGGSVDAGLRKGVFKARASLTGTLGLGAKLGGGVEIDPKRVVQGVRARLPTPVNQAITRGAQTARTLGNQVLNRGTQALQTAQQRGSQLLVQGKQRAQQLSASFRNFFSSPAPKAPVARAMSRRLVGG